MVQNQLKNHLDHVARRIKVARLWWSLAFAGAVLASLSLFTRFSEVSSSGRLSTLAAFGLLAVVAFAISVGTQWFVAPNYRSIAARVEQKFPDLDSRLLASVQIDVGPKGERLGFLEQSVIHQTLIHATRHSWQQIVSPYSMWGSRIATIATWGCFGVLLFLLWNSSDLLPAMDDRDEQKTVQTYTPTELESIDPGDTEIERGTSLIVFAGYSGSLPREATLVITTPDNEQRRIPMQNSFQDPVFAARVSSVNEDLVYHVELDDLISDSYQVRVFDYPRLERSDVTLKFPSYAGIPEKRVEDTRRVSALEGTEVVVEMFLNKPVDHLELIDESDPPIEVSVQRSSSDARKYEATFTLDQSRRFRLRLEDEAGRENREPPALVFNALPNRPAEIKIVTPSRDVRVSPLEELDMKAEIADDFGVAAYGISYTFHGETSELELGRWDPEAESSSENNSFVRTRATTEHRIYFEMLEAEPNEVLTYYFWASDYDANGDERRVFSDMFFADVRPFEEIFREGEQPPGGDQQQGQQQGQQGEQGGPAGELFELQMQIMNGTWNIIRRETNPELSETFADDVDVLRTSQQTVQELTSELAQQSEAPETTSIIEETMLSMQLSQERLGRAMLDGSRLPLREALDAERSALEGLMKLRAIEFEITRQQQQQQQSQSSQSSRRQQMQSQLEQLELDNEENRYQQESEASDTEEEEADRENRQLLNRLRELAQRQEDLNKQLQELQTALEEAKTEEEREAIERQLKRLREEQEEILRETDELADRAEQSANRDELEEARQQIEEAREDVVDANEALKNEDVSEAAAAGARAQSQFEDLRDEFQRRTSSQFQQRMEEMRDQAETIREREQSLSDALDQLQNPDGQSLRDDSNEEILNELNNQREDVRDLMNDMKEMVQEAEGTEPLLASNLYDAYRDAEQDQLDDALQQTRQLLDQGFVDQAAEVEDIAGESVDELADAVNNAADSLLGDQTEALRRAQQTLNELAEALDSELSDMNPDAAQNGNNPSDSESQNGEPQDGSQGSNEQQPIENEPNQGQSEEQEPNENEQPGQGQPGQSPSEQDPNDQQSQGSGQPQDGQPQDGQPQDGQSNSNNESNPQEQPSPSQGQGQQPGQQPSDQQSEQGQPMGQQPGQGQPGQGQPNSENQTEQQGQPQDRNSPNEGGAPALDRLLDFGGGGNPRPLTGDDYREWTDSMRDVEEMIGDPELRDEAAQIRERVRDIRNDYRRHSKEPDWEMVNEMVLVPLYQLRNRVNEELLKRANKEALVPIDRDPVPDGFADDVGEYYERIGSGR